ncbi:L-aspartate oxidase [Salicibibacter halophilus]|uniref:L-aspartate oxidase n=1 Tax=Salicibibacter halophilus TaxID=2502791 RepID=A0A514LJV2_9BACI|nr:L-aspartate oxidase [Salicibibacter halophilus]QDI92130.1 L-aspartate oxidase [Salicibibacter halophilus]
MNVNNEAFDVLIIGSGLAGLAVAETIGGKLNVGIFSKGKETESNSYRAQGGVAAALQADDGWENHWRDTLEAGDEHSDAANTATLTKAGGKTVQKLIDWGVAFDRDEDNRLLLGKEGAHGYPRIVHAGGDRTGEALVRTMKHRVQNHAQFFTEETVLSILKEDGSCVGVKTVDKKGEVHSRYAAHVVLATGGAGHLFSNTTNDSCATGDGYALAYRAGARLQDMEFVQFHPTMLATDTGSAGGLVTEAVRGAGARLVTGNDSRLMAGHPEQDLAGRDVVARAIHDARVGGEDVLLDLSPVQNLAERFPGVASLSERYGYTSYLPVAPGAHFMMGGVGATLDGETRVPGLYAVGEVASTGVHGANRLASNSLLEAVVTGERLGQRLLQEPGQRRFGFRNVAGADSQKILPPTKKDIQQVMDNACGVKRDAKTLKEAVAFFQPYFLANAESDDPDIQERNNMALLASIMVNAAYARTESRGSHYRDDHPTKNRSWQGISITWAMEQRERGGVAAR